MNRADELYACLYAKAATIGTEEVSTHAVSFLRRRDKRVWADARCFYTDQCSRFAGKPDGLTESHPVTPITDSPVTMS